jgi:cardiolipin synthase A/B
MSETAPTRWLRAGQEIFPAMLAAIGTARESIRLETYICEAGEIGRQFCAALTAAAGRGVRVSVLVDALGSWLLPDDFFAPLTAAGGEVRFFNPLRFSRFGVRDHRKLLVCDDRVAFIGGANIADDYDGDGVTRGWFDLMVRVEDTELARALAEDFENIFADAGLENLRLRKLRAFRKIRRAVSATQFFSVRPGRAAGGFQRALQHALLHARAADFIVPYFLPNRRLRKLLGQMVRRGGRVRLILPAHCDVPAARAAGLVYYARLLRAGVEIYEYQPQILHAKIYRVDENVFAGSSNLDVRSFKLNYELMLRFADPATVNGAKEIFEAALKNSRRVELKEFRAAQNFWERWKNRWAHFLLARIDPLIALRQFQALK